MPHYYTQVERCVDAVIDAAGPHIRLGLPLGLGKPNQWINALYQRVKQDDSLQLDIYTALSLEVPKAKSSLEQRFLGPFLTRLFDGYESLDYLSDLRNNAVPDHIRIYEFFIKSGSFLKHDYVQQHYLNCNYTHVPRDLMAYDLNVVAQAIAFDKDESKPYSFSCNPEISLELANWIKEKKQQGQVVCVVGQTHQALPYMPNDAAVEEEVFDFIVDNREYDTRLFAPPDMPVTKTDYLIGLYASTLIKDGGTLQIGIGSLSDAIVYACKLRHQNNDTYQSMLQTLQVEKKFASTVSAIGGTEAFKTGLYGCSEMFVDGFLDLMEANILNRKVYPDNQLQIAINQLEAQQALLDHQQVEPLKPCIPLLKVLITLGAINKNLDNKQLEWLKLYGLFLSTISLDQQSILLDGKAIAVNNLEDVETLKAIEKQCLGTELKQGIVMHGGFFLGPESFYQALRDMPKEKRSTINMTGIKYINSLYGQQALKTSQRQHARFINTTFTVSLLGAATSDGLENGQMVSGVGGQYNFVAQGNELEDARSILLLRATRTKNGETSSNIVWNYGHTTIPRHLRDIYITEYGIADIRAKSDAEVIKAMLNISDSRFQQDLMVEAKATGKLAQDYQIPEQFSNNYPDTDRNQLKSFRANGYLPRFPFGCDFTEQELRLGEALMWLSQRSQHKLQIVKLIAQGFFDHDERFDHLLARMQLKQPKAFKDKIERALVLSALKATYS